MTKFSRSAPARRAPLPSLLVAVALVLRLVAPLVAAPAVQPPDGYIAICTGSEIVYIAVTEAGFVPAPAEDAPEPRSEPCPWFAPLQAALLPDAPAIRTGWPNTSVRFHPPGPALAYADPLRSFHARAPPVWVV